MNTHEHRAGLSRVLMFVPHYPPPVVGGLEKQAHLLSRTLADDGRAVSVISGRINAQQPPLEELGGVVVRRVWWPQAKALRFLISSMAIGLALWRVRKDVDVVHVHQHSWVGLFVILTSKLLGKPVLTKLPNVAELGIPGLLTMACGSLRKRILFSSDAIVSMSLVSHAELVDAGYPTHRILGVPNGIALNPQSAASGPRSTDARCRVVYVGRLSEEKGIDMLLAAWSVVCVQTRAAATLEIWGDGPLLPSLKALSHALGLSGTVAFMGHVDDVSRRLRDVDIFVLPSRAEGNSNAVLEAMAAGLPVVSTRVGGTPMLVGNEGADFLCDPGEAATLTSLLLRLIEDSELRGALGAAMRRRVETHFDIKRVARIYASAYELLASGRRDHVARISSAIVCDET